MTAKPAPTADRPHITQVVDDEERLETYVAPPDWQNPKPAGRYNLVVVGGGTAGLVAAAGAAGLGARVALIEKHALGGDCLNVGCVPSKALIASGRALADARRLSVFGGEASGVCGDFAEIAARMRRLRADISRHDAAERFRDLGVDVFFGAGAFTAKDRLMVGGKELRFARACIATGSRASSLPIEGLEETGYLTNETLFDLTELPRRLLVLGAGPIGCEMAQSFARFGSQVTMLELMPRVLFREWEGASRVVHDALVHDGIRVELAVKTQRVRRVDGELEVEFVREDEPSALRCDAILVAGGRIPVTQGLGLEAAGVEQDPRLGVTVDDRLRTSNPRIFAAGDVASRYKFTHAADALARIVIRNALFMGREKVSNLVVPWCTYTDPELSHVGLSEEEAKHSGVPFETLDLSWASLDRHVLESGGEGLLHLLTSPGRGRILGATMVGPQAGDLIAPFVLAMQQGIGMKSLSNLVLPYPTRGELLKKAGDAWNRRRLTPGVARMIGWWMKLRR